MATQSNATEQPQANATEQPQDASPVEGAQRAAMRTSAYLVISPLGIGIAATAFLPWAGVPRADGSAYDFAIDVVGVDAGGWGEAAIVIGAAIFLLGLLGYFWNPFSDPEALFVAGFSALALGGVVVKMLDVASLVDPDGEYFDVDAKIAPGLWLLGLAAASSLLLALWILLSRPAAERTTSD